MINIEDYEHLFPERTINVGTMKEWLKFKNFIGKVPAMVRYIVNSKNVVKLKRARTETIIFNYKSYITVRTRRCKLYSEIYRDMYIGLTLYQYNVLKKYGTFKFKYLEITNARKYFFGLKVFRIKIPFEQIKCDRMFDNGNKKIKRLKFYGMYNIVLNINDIEKYNAKQLSGRNESWLIKI